MPPAGRINSDDYESRQGRERSQERASVRHRSAIPRDRSREPQILRHRVVPNHAEREREFEREQFQQRRSLRPWEKERMYSEEKDMVEKQEAAMVDTRLMEARLRERERERGKELERQSSTNAWIEGSRARGSGGSGGVPRTSAPGSQMQTGRLAQMAVRGKAEAWVGEEAGEADSLHHVVCEGRAVGATDAVAV